MKEWKLMVHDDYPGYPVYVRFDSERILTFRWLYGINEHIKAGYVESPQLGGQYRKRKMTMRLREMTEIEKAEYEPILKIALQKEEPK